MSRIRSADQFGRDSARCIGHVGWHRQEWHRPWLFWDFCGTTVFLGLSCFFNYRPTICYCHDHVRKKKTHLPFFLEWMNNILKNPSQFVFCCIFLNRGPMGRCRSYFQFISEKIATKHLANILQKKISGFYTRGADLFKIDWKHTSVGSSPLSIESIVIGIQNSIFNLYTLFFGKVGPS